jgi:hypothetical protein
VVTVAGLSTARTLGDQAVDRAQQPREEQEPVADQAHRVAAERPAGLDEGQGDAGHRQPDAEDLAPDQALPGDPAQQRAPDRHGGEHHRSPRRLGVPQPDVEGQREGREQHQPQQREQAQPLPAGPQQPGRDHQQDPGQQEPALTHPEDREADGRHVADRDPDRDHRRSEQHRRRRRARVGAQVGRPHRRRPDRGDESPGSHPLPSRDRLPER